MKALQFGIVALILAGLTVGIGSAGFMNDPTPLNDPNWKGFSFDVWDYKINPWGASKIVNLTEILFPEPKPEVPDEPQPEWTPAPVIVPSPLPLSKDELFGSLTTISANKKDLISSYKTKSFYF